MTTMDLAIPNSKDIALELPSRALYQLEQAGSLATEVLDERVAVWAAENKSKQWIADELGCTTNALGHRLKRLSIVIESRRGPQPKTPTPGVSVVEEEEIAPQDVEIIEEPREHHAHCTHCEVHCPSSRYRKDH